MGDQYYPGGGWYDLEGSYNEVKDAMKDALKERTGIGCGHDWFHIIEYLSGAMVCYGDRGIEVDDSMKIEWNYNYKHLDKPEFYK